MFSREFILMNRKLYPVCYVYVCICVCICKWNCWQNEQRRRRSKKKTHVSKNKRQIIIHLNANEEKKKYCIFILEFQVILFSARQRERERESDMCADINKISKSNIVAWLKCQQNFWKQIFSFCLPLFWYIPRLQFIQWTCLKRGYVRNICCLQEGNSYSELATIWNHPEAISTSITPWRVTKEQTASDGIKCIENLMCILHPHTLVLIPNVVIGVETHIRIGIQHTPSYILYQIWFIFII